MKITDVKMDKKHLILQHCKKAHALAEECYLEHSAAKGDPDWLNKRKYLLADLSLHMVQAALQEDHANSELIKRYLFSILTICEDFIPEADLGSAAKKLIN